MQVDGNSWGKFPATAKQRLLSSHLPPVINLRMQ